MKKLTLFILMLFGFMLNACSTTVSCSQDETEVAGLCIPTELAPLERALLHIQEADNYRLDILIDMDFTSVTLTILFDENKVFYDFVDEVIYFQFIQGQCYEYTFDDANNRVEQIVSCDSNDQAYGFYRALEASMFELVQEGLVLKEAYHSIFEDFFAQTLNEPRVSNVRIELQDERIDSLSFNLSAQEDSYTFVMTFTEFENVEVSID